MKKIISMLLILPIVFFFSACAFMNFDRDEYFGKKVDIIFEENGGSLVDDIILKYEKRHEFPVYPVKSGYRFAGWYYDNSTFFDPFNPYDFFINRTDDEITLYAKWGSIEHFTTLFRGKSVQYGITDDNRVLSWGANETGLIGDGTQVSKYDYVDITSHFNFAENESILSIASDVYGAVAITSLGRVFSWGTNEKGILGDGTEVAKLVPTEITSHFSLNLNEVPTSISIDQNMAFLCTSEGRVFTWGQTRFLSSGGSRFLLGMNTTQFSPFDITDKLSSFLNPNETVTELYVSSYDDIFVMKTSSNRVFLWGKEVVGWFPSQVSYLEPQDITTIFQLNISESIGKVTFGYSLVFFHTSQERLLAIGEVITDEYYFYPTSQSALSPYIVTNEDFLNPSEYIIEIYADMRTVIILTSQSRVFIWGYNAYLGLNTSDDYEEYIPAKSDMTHLFSLNPNEELISMVARDGCIHIFTSDGRLFAFGNNHIGQYGIGGTLEIGVPVKVYE